jgi:hypothetical protein
MPAEYLAIERQQLKSGKSKKVAKRIAAATYNKKHPGNPVTKDYDKKHPMKMNKKKKKKGKKKVNAQGQINKGMKILGY